ncbi:YfhD family protein [Bacillus benzoevorans]|uniref:YfhD family protein n=1 Tax=Bacillus benzoevorans TaxID=1456 RepID=A0A7X0HVU5_9BACI|nr:YfhD family protein [Bacillus benzoevorans]MBB6447825.1 hypothetical protein [Bacillus benzoevorans]
MGVKKKNHKLKAKGLDVEFSQELADQDDLQAQARALAAKQRVQAAQSKS